jgi:hypothetical protein
MTLLLSNLLSHEEMKIPGGRFVLISPSIADPQGGVIVICICDKHPKKPIKVSASITHINDVYDVLESCSGCIEDREQKMSWKNTRWPEGAEI